MKTHQDLYDAAMDAIRDLFSDTSVSPEETRADLETIANEVFDLANSLQED